MTKGKKSQHEILGFVLIVVIVTIIGVIFLSLTIGREKQKELTVEMSNLLQSSMYQTTECAVSYIPEYEDIQGLIRECYEDDSQKCLNEKKVCEELESSLRGIVDRSLDIGEDSPNKAYELDVYYTSFDETENKEEIVYLEKGNFANCSYITGGSHSIAVSRYGYGNINIELEVCKS